MKPIEPLEIWYNGTVKVAEYLQVTGINDNYENSATNYWQLFTKIVNDEDVESQGEQVAQGNLTINGQDYINWGGTACRANK
jgi:beta-lactamase class D